MDVPTGCRGGQYLHPEAFGAHSIGGATAGGTISGGGLPIGRAQYRAWCEGERQRPARPSRHPGYLLRGLGAGRAPRLSGGRAARQARAGGWRSQEPPDRDARCRSGRHHPRGVHLALRKGGERCLAGSVAVAVGKAQDALLEALKSETSRLQVGPGNQPGVQVGPLIRDEHRQKVLGYIERGIQEGAHLLVDGRGYVDQPGFFLGPTILDQIAPEMTVGRDEIFGPVLAVSHVQSLEEAISQANQSVLGNMATIFTQSGRVAREFREQVEVVMVGVNVGVAQPFAFYPFSGWKGSFYGDLHLHGTDGLDFFTRKKMVVSRW